MTEQLSWNGDSWRIDNIAPHVSVAFKNLFRGIPAGRRPPFMLKDSPATVRDLQWFMTRYQMTIADDSIMHFHSQIKVWQDGQDRLMAMQQRDYVPPAISGFRDGEAARAHQLRAAQMLRATGSLLLMDDVGLGKTVSALAAIADGWGLPAAVVVQAHLSRQWVVQYINRFTHLRAVEIKDRKAKELPPADIYVFRYSNIAAWVDYLAASKVKTMILDEVQELRHGKSTDKGTAIHALRGIIPNWIGLTATPIYNYGGEMWSIVDLIRPGALGTWEEFVTNHCTYVGTHPVVREPQALGSYLISEGIVLRRTNEDAEVAMTLPPLSKVVVEVGWNEADAESDRELQRRLALRVINGSWHEKGQAARELDKMVRHETGVAKARSVAAYTRMLVEAGEGVLLGGWHRAVYDIWLAALADLNPVMFTGSETDAQKQRAKAAIMAGDSRLMIMSLRSGAGVDGLQQVLTESVFGELDWSPQVHTQFTGRLRRDGQKKPVRAHYLWTDNGSDPPIMGTLGLKAAQSSGILDPWSEVIEGTPIDESRMVLLAKSILEKGG